MRPLPIIALATSLLCSCSSSSHTDAVDAADEVAVSATTMEVAPRDSDFYHMGRRHAAFIINKYTHPDSIGARLLEVRAREHQLRQRVDDQAARTYIYGFEQYVRQNAPALADSIL